MYQEMFILCSDLVKIDQKKQNFAKYLKNIIFSKNFIHFRLHTYIFQYMSIGYVFSIIDKISRFYFHLGIFV